MKTQYMSAMLAILAGPIALCASSETDRKIEDAATASYNYRTVLEDNVKVKANDGIVTLTGTVRDRDDRALAQDTVENLPGVSSVRNQITVTTTHPEHSDAWIALKLRGQLLVKANVSATNTTIAVEDGVVTLGGTADNLAQKELTGSYAKDIKWVKSVKNDMVVSEATTVGQTVAVKMDDASITTQVKFALLGHKSTSGLKTKVSTQDGAITISGEAKNDAERSLVTKLAQDVRGVQSVTNNMTVKG